MLEDDLKRYSKHNYIIKNLVIINYNMFLLGGFGFLTYLLVKFL